ncbi:hypothetical protein ACL02S_23245 [Nocardia sp. 004]|uniref:hypothetical protein n=1 Tax=Nocardia sp. 004 TaxID=3385978 RepID=UPI0039A0B832
MTATPPPEKMHFTLVCDSPNTRYSFARNEGLCDWPHRRFSTTATPQEVADKFYSCMNSYHDIDHIVFTAIGRPHHLPYLEAHLVDGHIRVHVAPLHSADSSIRAIVHRLNAAIIDEFKDRSTMIEIPPNIVGLDRWARTVLAQAPTTSIDAEIARRVQSMLYADIPETAQKENRGLGQALAAAATAHSGSANPDPQPDKNIEPLPGIDTGLDDPPEPGPAMSA